jgi:hypothetical protein
MSLGRNVFETLLHFKHGKSGAWAIPPAGLQGLGFFRVLKPLKEKLKPRPHT